MPGVVQERPGGGAECLVGADVKEDACDVVLDFLEMVDGVQGVEHQQRDRAVGVDPPVGPCKLLKASDVGEAQEPGFVVDEGDHGEGLGVGVSGQEIPALQEEDSPPQGLEVFCGGFLAGDLYVVADLAGGHRAAPGTRGGKWCCT